MDSFDYRQIEDMVFWEDTYEFEQAISEMEKENE